MPQVTERDIENWFTFHPPTGQQQQKYEAIRAAAKELALTIYHNTPESPDQTAAIRKVREAVMTANQGIALAGAGAHAG